MTSPTDIHRARPPEELPAYPVPRAARRVRLSPSTRSLWACGEGERKALCAPASCAPLLLSFSNLIEAFALASMRQVHGISMQRVRKALRYVGSCLARLARCTEVVG